MVYDKYYEVPYQKTDLMDFLKRHSNKSGSECECQCPYTGNSISMLLQFVFITNEDQISDDSGIILKASIRISEELSNKACLIGKNRLVTAAAIFWLASLRTGRRRTQSDAAEYFCTTTNSIRFRWREIDEIIGGPDRIII